MALNDRSAVTVETNITSSVTTAVHVGVQDTIDFLYRVIECVESLCDINHLPSPILHMSQIIWRVVSERLTQLDNLVSDSPCCGVRDWVT